MSEVFDTFEACLTGSIGFIRGIGNLLLREALNRIVPIELRTVDIDEINACIAETSAEYALQSPLDK